MAFAYLSREKSFISSHILLLNCDANASPPLNPVSHHPQSYDNTIWHSASPHEWSWRWLGSVCLQACLWQDEDVVSRRAAARMTMMCRFRCPSPSGLQEDRHSDVGVQSEGLYIHSSAVLNLSQVSDGHEHCPSVSFYEYVRILSSPCHASTPHFWDPYATAQIVESMYIICMYMYRGRNLWYCIHNICSYIL